MTTEFRPYSFYQQFEQLTQRLNQFYVHQGYGGSRLGQSYTNGVATIRLFTWSRKYPVSLPTSTGEKIFQVTLKVSGGVATVKKQTETGTEVIFQTPANAATTRVFTAFIESYLEPLLTRERWQGLTPEHQQLFSGIAGMLGSIGIPIQSTPWALQLALTEYQREVVIREWNKYLAAHESATLNITAFWALLVSAKHEQEKAIYAHLLRVNHQTAVN